MSSFAIYASLKTNLSVLLSYYVYGECERASCARRRVFSGIGIITRETRGLVEVEYYSRVTLVASKEPRQGA